MSESKKKKNREYWKTNGHNVRGILQDKQERIDMNEWMERGEKGEIERESWEKKHFFLKKNFKKRERVRV